MLIQDCSTVLIQYEKRLLYCKRQICYRCRAGFQEQCNDYPPLSGAPVIGMKYSQIMDNYSGQHIESAVVDGRVSLSKIGRKTSRFVLR